MTTEREKAKDAGLWFLSVNYKGGAPVLTKTFIDGEHTQGFIDDFTYSEPDCQDFTFVVYDSEGDRVPVKISVQAELEYKYV